MSSKNMTLGDAAVRVLTEAGEPLHYGEITRRILDQGLAGSDSKTPAASLGAEITVDIKRHGKAIRFVRVSPGVYGLRSWGTPSSTAPEQAADVDAPEQRVRIPLYPAHSEVRLVLPIWAGKPRTQVTHLRATIGELRGTPQATVDWTNPDQWIPERLTGDDQALAMEIWQKSKKQVNPRYVYGHWLLARGYGLLDERPDETLHLTERGRDFVNNPDGATELLIDDNEGLIKLLSLVAAHGPARVRELEAEWREYLQRWSGFGSESTIKDSLRRRLRNLLLRGLISRSTAQYSVTDAGLAYLGRVDGEDAAESEQEEQLLTLVKQQ